MREFRPFTLREVTAFVKFHKIHFDDRNHSKTICWSARKLQKTCHAVIIRSYQAIRSSQEADYGREMTSETKTSPEVSLLFEDIETAQR